MITHSKCLFAHQTHTGFWLVSYSDIRIPHWSLRAGTNWASYLHISLSLPIISWWYAGRIIAGSVSANERVEWSPVGQSEARWHWWVRGWPVVTSVVTVIRSPNMGHGRLMNVGCHTVIDMPGQSWLLQKSPDKYSLLLSTRHSLHFSSSPDYSDWLCTSLLRSMGCSDVWMSGRVVG